MNNLLDHYYVELRNNCFAVVVGNKHYKYLIIGYIKYCPTNRKTPWLRDSIHYKRIVYKYDPLIVHRSAYMKQFIPYYGIEVPVIPVSSISRIYDPLDKKYELYHKPRDSLEDKALRLVSELEYYSKTSNGIGITGSILLGIHNPNISDIDLVVYGWKNSIEIIEAIREKQTSLKPFSRERLKIWAQSNAEATGLTVKQVLKYYRLWRRGVYMDKEYSIIYNKGVREEFTGTSNWITKRIVKIKAYLRGGLEGLNYPLKTSIEEYEVLEGYASTQITEILSFEALYMPLFYEGGEALITGLLQYNLSEDTCRIIVGGVEYPGKIIWVK